MSYHDAVCLPAPDACRACGGPKPFHIVPVCEACLAQTFDRLLASYRLALGFPADAEEDD